MPIPEASQHSPSHQTDSSPSGMAEYASANENKSAATVGVVLHSTEPAVSTASDAPSDIHVACGSFSSLTATSLLTPISSHLDSAAAVHCNSTTSSKESHSVLLLVGCSDGSLRSFSLGAGAEGGQLKMFRKKKPLPEISAAAVLGRWDCARILGEQCTHMRSHCRLSKALFKDDHWLCVLPTTYFANSTSVYHNEVCGTLVLAAGGTADQRRVETKAVAVAAPLLPARLTISRPSSFMYQTSL